MGTFWHKLRQTYRKTIPRHCIFYDCETSTDKRKNIGKVHKLKLGCATYTHKRKAGKPYTKEHIYFIGVDEFWDFVEDHSYNKSSLYLFAHQQQFDFLIVNGFEELVKRGWVMSKPIIDSNLFIVTFRKEGRSIKVLDTLNFYKTSLKSLGEMINVHKGEIDFETCTFEELLEYCERDVEIITKGVHYFFNFLHENNLGVFNPTIASQAFYTYRFGFMTEDIFIHADSRATRLERESYTGGRTEAFKLGKISGKTYAIDVNSLYPSVMIDNYFPTKFVFYKKNPTMNLFKNTMRSYLIIAKVKVKVTTPCVPLKKERLLFPIGTFTTTLCQPEIEYVMKHHKILEVFEMTAYEKSKIFKKYVQFFYDLRKQFKKAKNHVFDGITKLFLNALYGKFGQKTESQIEVGECPPGQLMVETVYDIPTGKRYTQLSFGGKIYHRYSGKEEWEHSMVAVSSFVTSYARLVLLDGITRAGRINVHYVDTDGMYVNRKGIRKMKKFLHALKLGFWKLEEFGYNFTIFGVKDYIFEGKVKLKGIRGDAVLIGKNTYKQMRMLKFRSSLRKGILNGVVEVEIIKRLKRIYKKGIVGMNGIIHPYVLEPS